MRWGSLEPIDSFACSRAGTVAVRTTTARTARTIRSMGNPIMRWGSFQNIQALFQVNTALFRIYRPFRVRAGISLPPKNPLIALFSAEVRPRFSTFSLHLGRLKSAQGVVKWELAAQYTSLCAKCTSGCMSRHSQSTFEPSYEWITNSYIWMSHDLLRMNVYVKIFWEYFFEFIHRPDRVE